MAEGFMNDEGSLTNRTREFFMYKTIQRAYNFMVMFDESNDTDGWNVLGGLSSFHAVSVDVPDYSFQKELMKFGAFNYTFPTLNHEGFAFSIKLEEDDQGRVKELITSLISRTIDKDGYYVSLDKTFIPQIVVDIYRPNGDNIWKIKFQNCYFLKADGGNYDFSSGDKITYNLEFNADHYELVSAQGSLNPSLIRKTY